MVIDGHYSNNYDYIYKYHKSIVNSIPCSVFRPCAWLSPPCWSAPSAGPSSSSSAPWTSALTCSQHEGTGQSRGGSRVIVLWCAGLARHGAHSESAWPRRVERPWPICFGFWLPSSKHFNHQRPNPQPGLCLNLAAANVGTSLLP